MKSLSKPQTLLLLIAGVIQKLLSCLEQAAIWLKNRHVQSIIIYTIVLYVCTDLAVIKALKFSLLLWMLQRIINKLITDWFVPAMIRKTQWDAFFAFGSQLLIWLLSFLILLAFNYFQWCHITHKWLAAIVLIIFEVIWTE